MSRDIYKLIAPSLTVLPLLCCSGAPKVSAPAKDLEELASRMDAMPDGTVLKMLFVVNVSSGEVVKDGEGKRALSFSESDVTSIVGFTDRPQRYAFDMTVPMLASIWDQGKDSFASDPPNAVIEDSRFRVGITEVMGLRVEESAVTFQLDRMAYKSIDSGDSLDGEVEALTLFIDSSWLKVTGASLSLGLQQAAKACVSVDCEFWPLGG